MFLLECNLIIQNKTCLYTFYQIKFYDERNGRGFLMHVATI